MLLDNLLSTRFNLSLGYNMGGTNPRKSSIIRFRGASACWHWLPRHVWASCKVGKQWRSKQKGSFKQYVHETRQKSTIKPNAHETRQKTVTWLQANFLQKRLRQHVNALGQERRRLATTTAVSDEQHANEAWQEKSWTARSYRRRHIDCILPTQVFPHIIGDPQPATSLHSLLLHPTVKMIFWWIFLSCIIENGNCFINMKQLLSKWEHWSRFPFHWIYFLDFQPLRLFQRSKISATYYWYGEIAND